MGLTLSELRELRDAAESLLNDPAGDHIHISSANYQMEITLWVADESGEMLASS